jgi:hypothetical protein
VGASLVAASAAAAAAADQAERLASLSTSLDDMRALVGALTAELAAARDEAAAEHARCVHEASFVSHARFGFLCVNMR